MTGDGTNDASALAQADVGVAMNTGTQAAKEAGNMVDLDSNPTKLIEIVEIGKQLLITRGALTTFSVANDVAKYFAIIPAMFAGVFPVLGALNVMHLHTPESAILSAVIFNAVIIIALVPLALRGSLSPDGSSGVASTQFIAVWRWRNHCSIYRNQGYRSNADVSAICIRGLDEKKHPYRDMVHSSDHCHLRRAISPGRDRYGTNAFSRPRQRTAYRERWKAGWLKNHWTGLHRLRLFSFAPSSAGTGYDPMASGGSNLAPTNKNLIERVKADVQKLRGENPDVPIPVDLVTTSASGLDPDISPEAAEFQIPRVAHARNMKQEDLRALLQKHTKGRDLGFLGEPRVNVLELNLELDSQRGH
jgi:K+-transporting ATPase, c chain